MKLVVGLGNPGIRYVNTRHNAGFLVVDKLATLYSRAFKREGSELELLKVRNLDGGLLLFKPQLYMNKSGVAVKAVFKKHPKKFEVPNLENLWVVHDDLDIKLGEYKINFGKGPREHNGLKNIYEQIGTKDFWHVRVGIDNGEFRETGEKYVLSKWKPDEKKVLNRVVDKIVKELKNVLA